MSKTYDIYEYNKDTHEAIFLGEASGASPSVAIRSAVNDESSPVELVEGKSYRAVIQGSEFTVAVTKQLDIEGGSRRGKMSPEALKARNEKAAATRAAKKAAKAAAGDDVTGDDAEVEDNPFG